MNEMQKMIAMARAFGGGSGASGGSALPTTTEPHMHLVADKDGLPAWEPRTHYEAYEEGVLMPEKAADAVQDSIMALFAYPCLETRPAAGMELAITYNGAEYKCVCVDGAAYGEVGVMMAGNIGVITGGEVTGEPFVALFPVDEAAAANEGIGAMAYILDGATAVTLKVDYAGNVVHQLDNKYLNLSQYATKEEVTSKTDAIEANLSENYLTRSAYEYEGNKGYSLVRSIDLAGVADTGEIDVSAYKALYLQIQHISLIDTWDDEPQLVMYDADGAYLCTVSLGKEIKDIFIEPKHNNVLTIDCSYVSNGYPMEMKRFTTRKSAKIKFGTMKFIAKNGTVFPDSSHFWVYGVFK